MPLNDILSNENNNSVPQGTFEHFVSALMIDVCFQ